VTFDPFYVGRAGCLGKQRNVLVDVPCRALSRSGPDMASPFYRASRVRMNYHVSIRTLEVPNESSSDASVKSSTVGIPLRY
jgi:hypothetical protein